MADHPAPATRQTRDRTVRPLLSFLSFFLKKKSPPPIFVAFFFSFRRSFESLLERIERGRWAVARVSLLSSTSGQNNRFVSRRRRESRRPCGSTSSHQGHRQWLNQQKISHRVHPFKKSEKKDITRRRSRSSGGRDPQSSSGNP